MRRGVSFTVNGEARELRFDINALCTLEDRFGCGVDELQTRLGDRPRVADLRAVFWAGLQGGPLTEEEAGDIMSALGMAEAFRLIGEAFALAFDVPAEGAPPAGKRKAAA